MKVKTTLCKAVELPCEVDPSARGDDFLVEYEGVGTILTPGFADKEMKVTVKIQGPRSIFRNVKLGDVVDYDIHLEV